MGPPRKKKKKKIQKKVQSPKKNGGTYYVGNPIYPIIARSRLVNPTVGLRLLFHFRYLQ